MRHLKYLCVSYAYVFIGLLEGCDDLRSRDVCIDSLERLLKLIDNMPKKENVLDNGHTGLQCIFFFIHLKCIPQCFKVIT